MPGVTLRNIDSPAAYTRGHRKAYPGYNTPHVKLPDNWEGQTRRYHGYLKKKKAHDKAHGKTGGRRRKTRRHTRRR